MVLAATVLTVAALGAGVSAMASERCSGFPCHLEHDDYPAHDVIKRQGWRVFLPRYLPRQAGHVQEAAAKAMAADRSEVHKPVEALSNRKRSSGLTSRVRTDASAPLNARSTKVGGAF